MSEIDEARAEAAALRAAVDRMRARFHGLAAAEIVRDNEGSALHRMLQEGNEWGGAVLATDAGRKALDAVRLAALAMQKSKADWERAGATCHEFDAALAALRAAFPGVE